MRRSSDSSLTGFPLLEQEIGQFCVSRFLAGCSLSWERAAGHYADGSFVMADGESACAKTNPKTGAALGFWHPPLVTLHFLIWYPNPDGVFGEFNSYLSPFNND